MAKIEEIIANSYVPGTRDDARDHRRVPAAGRDADGKGCIEHYAAGARRARPRRPTANSPAAAPIPASPRRPARRRICGGRPGRRQGAHRRRSIWRSKRWCRARRRWRWRSCVCHVREELRNVAVVFPDQARRPRAAEPHRRLADVPVQRRRRLRQRLAYHPSRHAGEFRRRPLVVEATHVERHGRITHGCAGLYSDANEAALARVIAHCRRIGTAKLGIQLAHAGRKASAQRPWEGGGALKPEQDPWQTIAPSAIPFGADWHTPRAMNEDDIARVRDAFVSCGAARGAHRLRRHRTALRARLSRPRFLSPISNKRTDRYGGSLENRMRFPLEIAQAVRAVVPKGTPLGARITGSDWTEGGLTARRRGRLSARRSRPTGLDFVDVSSGGITADTRNPTDARLQRADRRAASSSEAGMPTRTVGLIVDAAAGRSDRRRGQGRHGGDGARHARRPALGLACGAGARCRGRAPAKQYLRAAPKLWAPAVHRAPGVLMDLFVFAAVLFAAACHAGWNAVIKRGLDPFATTALIAVGAGVVALPLVPFVGMPAPAAWPWLIASVASTSCYFIGLIESLPRRRHGAGLSDRARRAPLMTAAVDHVLRRRADRAVGWVGIVAARRRRVPAFAARRARPRDARPARGRLRAVHRGDDLRLFAGRRHRRARPSGNAHAYAVLAVRRQRRR